MKKTLKIFSALTFLSFISFFFCSYGLLYTENIYCKSIIYFLFFLIGDYFGLFLLVKFMYKIKTIPNYSLDEIAGKILEMSSENDKPESL